MDREKLTSRNLTPQSTFSTRVELGCITRNERETDISTSRLRGFWFDGLATHIGTGVFTNFAKNPPGGCLNSKLHIWKCTSCLLKCCAFEVQVSPDLELPPNRARPYSLFHSTGGIAFFHVSCDFLGTFGSSLTLMEVVRRTARRSKFQSSSKFQLKLFRPTSQSSSHGGWNISTAWKTRKPNDLRNSTTLEVENKTCDC